MNVTIKALIVWLMLLAVPLQGFASASTLLCAQPPAAAPHVSVQSGSANAAVLVSAVEAAAHDMAAAHHHPHEKCGACASCCGGASMTPSFVPPLAAAQTRFIASAPDLQRLSSVDLDLPERPPRA